jgi:hypothetical protein
MPWYDRRSTRYSAPLVGSARAPPPLLLLPATASARCARTASSRDALGSPASSASPPVAVEVRGLEALVLPPWDGSKTALAGSKSDLAKENLAIHTL